MALAAVRTAFANMTLRTTTTTTTTLRRGVSWMGLPHQKLLSSGLPRQTAMAFTIPRCSTNSHITDSCVTSLSSAVTPLSLPSQVREFHTGPVCLASLYQMHRTGPIKKKRKNKNPLGKVPYARGVVLRTLIKKPKKPNSANRKCVLVRLTKTGKEMIAYVPGEGHNLQEHNIVLVRPGRLRDTPGVKVRCVRGKYDLGHVMKAKRV